MAFIHETGAEIAEAEAASNVTESHSKDMPSIAAAATGTVDQVEERNAKTSSLLRIGIEELNKRCPSSKNFQKVSIYRVPDAYRRVQVKEDKEHMYSPMLVGLGPYHHSSGDLSGLRKHKLEAVYKALTRMKSSFKDKDEDSTSFNPQRNEEATQKDAQNAPGNDEKEEEEESRTNNYPSDDDAENAEQEENVEEINEKLLPDLLDWLGEKVCSLRENIENAYADEIEFDPDMFILDSCFLLEVGSCIAKLDDENYSKKDKFHTLLHPKRLKIKSVRVGITSDFIKLENQLPMELLHMMHDLQTPEGPEDAFFKSMYAIIRRHIPSPSKERQNIARNLLFPKKNPPRHLLEWLQRISVEALGLNFKSPPENLPTPENDDKRGCTRSHRIEIGRIEERTRCKPEVKEETKSKEHEKEKLKEEKRKAWWIPTARELRKAGIEIVAKGELDFKRGFRNWRGRLEIPKVKLNDGSEVALRNIIAFEEQAVQKNVISRFARVMENLVKKEEDVAKLRDADVLEHSLGSDSQVTRLFNGISEHITKQPHSGIDKKMIMVKDSCKNSARVMLIEFFRLYFSRPWYFVAFLAATIGLVCAILQAVYTIKK